MAYSLLAGTDRSNSIEIPGGFTLYLTQNDDDFVAQCSIVNTLHQLALQAWIRRLTT